MWILDGKQETLYTTWRNQKNCCNIQLINVSYFASWPLKLAQTRFCTRFQLVRALYVWQVVNYVNYVASRAWNIILKLLWIEYLYLGSTLTNCIKVIFCILAILKIHHRGLSLTTTTITFVIINITFKMQYSILLFVLNPV